MVEETDVLVIGSGMAGAAAAIAADSAGACVALVTKATGPSEATTRYAQGGIATVAPDDSPDSFAQDILKAGCGLSDETAVRFFTTEGPRVVQEVLIEKLGVPFDRNADGTLAYGRESGHSRPRILHVADATGSAIERAFMQFITRRTKITVKPDTFTVDLILRGGKVIGATTIPATDPSLERQNLPLSAILARNTILATGGIGDLYANSTNPPGNSGDGVAMAARAGAVVRNAEFVQFHPTAFVSPKGRNLLVTEAVRGEGAILRNARGEAFMAQYDPLMKDLAHRYKVAHAVDEQRALTGEVYLDIEPVLAKLDFTKRFPSVYNGLLAEGYDAVKEHRIPVRPAEHFFCGGVAVDFNGLSNVPNLYAVGEVSCTGIHGADRLASASLLEGLVWGTIAGRHAAAKRTASLPPASEVGEVRVECLDQPLPPGFANAKFTRLRDIMWQFVGLKRMKEGLERAFMEILKLKGEADDFARFRLDPDLIVLKNACYVASIICRAALDNPASVGSHYRVD
ncbi:MAG: L-aspartate oxidase [bacterium]